MTKKKFSELKLTEEQKDQLFKVVGKAVMDMYDLFADKEVTKENMYKVAHITYEAAFGISTNYERFTELMKKVPILKQIFERAKS